MTDLEKPKRTRKKKPPTQIAGVSGIDGHGAMGEAPNDAVGPAAPTIDWHRLISLPAFEMFVFEQSGFANVHQINSWVNNRREALGDEKLYKLYADWHSNKGYWINETPTGELTQEVK